MNARDYFWMGFIICYGLMSMVGMTLIILTKSAQTIKANIKHRKELNALTASRTSRVDRQHEGGERAGTPSSSRLSRDGLPN